MLPVNPRHLYFQGYPEDKVYRQVWVPATFAYPPALMMANRRMLPLAPPARARAPVRQTSPKASEELVDVANVLLDLAPKQANLGKRKAEDVVCPSNSASEQSVPETITASSSSEEATRENPTPFVVRPAHGNTSDTQSPSAVSDSSSLDDDDDDDDSSSSSFFGGDTTKDDRPTKRPRSTSQREAPFAKTEDNPWHEGTTTLALSTDADSLSPLHCFMRRYCVEVFSATTQELAIPRYGKSHGQKIVHKQVGIRCIYCKYRSPDDRRERAVCFPSSLKNIYHSIETWQRRHSLVCQDIPFWVRRSLVELLESSKSHAGGRRQYWEDSALRIGLVDTPHGIRFSVKPGNLVKSECPPVQENVEPARPIVVKEDRELVTGYLFLLMDQMETCHFTEADRQGGRSKIKDNEVGFPGMQCKHCQGKAGFGRYFPLNAVALGLANSDRNIYNHIKKCRRCPLHIKNCLLDLAKTPGQTKNRRGSRKVFFERIWNRMHDEKEK